MRQLASSKHFCGLIAIPFLAVMLAFSAGAQTRSESQNLSTSTGGAQKQSDSSDGTRNSNQATSETGAYATPPSTEANSTATEPETTPGSKKPGSSIVITVDKTKQEMTVWIDGIEKYDWPVSTGRAGYSTPSGTYTPTSMNAVWYSKQWDNSPMPHSIFFMKDGHAIHGSYEVKTLGKPVSHGCVRISPQNAATLYSLVEKNGLENTQVVLIGVTPGGESNEPEVASQENPGSVYGQERLGWYQPGNNYYYYSQPQRRIGFFRRLFGGPYANGPQGYYAPAPAYYPPRGY